MCVPARSARMVRAFACYAQVLGTLPKLLIFIALYTLPIDYNALRRSVETSARGL